MKTKVVYKLLRVRKDGSLGSLFANRRAKLPLNKWLKAGRYPTKKLKTRVGWHCVLKPKAPHLSLVDRGWYKVEVVDFKYLEKPVSQGKTWVLAKRMRILERA